MKKIKYQGGTTKLITSLIANQNRKNFEMILFNKQIKEFIYLLNTKAKYLKINIVSFSSRKDFPEQVLSILTCLKYFGRPTVWKIYSDGSHTDEQIVFLTKNFPFVKFINENWGNYSELPNIINENLSDYSKYLLHYAQEKELGKRLYYYLNEKVTEPTLFLDSDVLFYSKSRNAFEMMVESSISGWYLPDDKWGCLDSRYKKIQNEQTYQVNGGFFLFNKPLNSIEKGLDFLKTLDFKYEYFSDQNVFHIILFDNGFFPMDPRIFILNSSDQFDFSYIIDKKDIAIRHYTGPTRHKIWQKGWKWHLEMK